MVRTVKREPVSTRGGSSKEKHGIRASCSNSSNGNGSSSSEDFVDRRILRSRYLTVKSLISDERDNISTVDSDKFMSIIEEVDRLHQQVQKPREQVADAEALLDITNTLVTSVKAQSNEGVTPSDFISCLLKNYGTQGEGTSGGNESRNLICWKDIGLAVSHFLRNTPGCCTMVGPMNAEVKQRKPNASRKRVRPGESSRPEELGETCCEEKKDTDKNMATMFDILRKNKKVQLENLILNRNSFAQTVENLFALSFLVKDGRVEISVNDKGSHLVSPKNAPAANEVRSGEVSYSHFVFRFDFADWKSMLASVRDGEELMPHRKEMNISANSQTPLASGETQAPLPTTPIRKLSRNRGLVLQEQTFVEDSPESDDMGRAAAIRKGKRKLR